MAEYIITIKQLATVIAKCHGIPLADKDGNPIFNSLEIDGNEVVELPEIVRCRDCKFYNDSDAGCNLFVLAEHKLLHVRNPDGFCAWGTRRDE